MKAVEVHSNPVTGILNDETILPLPVAPQVPILFPTQRNIKRLPLSPEPQTHINEWFENTGITLGSVIPDEPSRDKVKRLLYTYREINAIELKDIPPTDLYQHKVRILPGTAPWLVKSQKRWPPAQKFWLDKTINEGIACGLYERTLATNRELSD